jgi:hypothetical protein
MQTSTPLLDHHLRHDSGFSIVEAIVSALLLVLSTAAIISIFDYSLLSLRRSGDRDTIAAAISADIATIERMNDRYSCDIASGTCSEDENKPANPTKFDYAPGLTDSGWPRFKELCNSPTTQASPGLATALIDKINQTSSITTTSNGRAIAILRTARPHPDNNKADTLEGGMQVVYPRHLYIVEWIPEQGPKRELVLTPTVANWCP